MKPKRKRGQLSGNQAISALIVIAILVVIGTQIFLTIKESQQLDAQATTVAQSMPEQADPTQESRIRPTRTPFVRPTQTAAPTLHPTQTGPDPITLRFGEDPAMVQKRDWASSLGLGVSHDGKFVATSDSRLDIVHVYEVASGQETMQLMGLYDIVRDIGWSPDGLYVAAGDIDGRTLVWEVATGEVIHEHKVEHSSYEVGWSLNGTYFAAMSAFDLTVWDVSTWDEVYQYRVGAPVSMAWSPTTMELVFTDDKGLFRVTWDGDLTSEKRILEFPSNFIDTDISPDGSTLAAITDENQLLLFEWPSAELRYSVRGHIAELNHVTWSPDSQYVVTSSDDETARIWDTATGRIVYTLELGFTVHNVEWREDNDMLFINALYTTLWPNPISE